LGEVNIASCDRWFGGVCDNLGGLIYQGPLRADAF
jgi:hypothetical protein